MMKGSSYTTLEMDERRPKTEAEDELEEPFNEEFWTKVQHKFEASGEISWSRAMDEIRVERLFAKYNEKCLLVIIRDWPASKPYKDRPELVASLEKLISRFTEIILEQDSDKRFKYFQVDKRENKARPTLLHLAAEQNFVHVCMSLVRHYPALVYSETLTVGEERGYLAVEIALMRHHDDTAAYLVSHMKEDWVHDLFLYDKDLKKSKFSLGELIGHRNPVTNKPDMKKTVVAVLDTMVNPHWPYLPERTKDVNDKSKRIDQAWATQPDDPLNYDFFYHVLDGDEQGRQPKIRGRVNEDFDPTSKSCLRCLTESDNKEAILHPVIRLLVMRKWNQFGLWWFRFHAILYLVFLLLLSYALLRGATRDDPMQYDEPADKLRLCCEILSIIYLVVYIMEEMDEANRDAKAYFWDPYNWFDWFGIILILLVIPLRLVEVDAQWSVAALGFLFNFLRLFKFSCVTRTTGLYTKTIAKIIYRDITRFMVVFLIMCLGFCGAMFMALKATGSQDMFSHFGWLMLAAVRALAEGQPVEEDYSKFRWLPILILLGYMTLVIVVLLNVLIAQLSYTYSEAKSNAKLQYAIDRMVIITRLERSRFARFNLRVKYYKQGDRVDETHLVEELLEYSEERHPWESMERKLSLIRDLMRKVLRRMSE